MDVLPGSERAQFDVIVDGEVIASRRRNLLYRCVRSMGWPDGDRVVAEIASRKGLSRPGSR